MRELYFLIYNFSIFSEFLNNERVLVSSSEKKNKAVKKSKIIAANVSVTTHVRSLRKLKKLKRTFRRDDHYS